MVLADTNNYSRGTLCPVLFEKKKVTLPPTTKSHQMKIQPQGRKLLVLPIQSKEEKVGSIVIPDSVATADLSEGEVIEVSPELEEKYPIGTKILYPSSAGLGQIYNGVPHKWLRENLEEVWAKIVE